jgi:hypothetical protein
VLRYIGKENCLVLPDLAMLDASALLHYLQQSKLLFSVIPWIFKLILVSMLNIFFIDMLASMDEC